MTATFSSRTALPAALTAMVFATSCADASPTEPIAATQPAAHAARTIPDLSGSWVWNEITVIQAREWAVSALFGVAPEGPVTHITCESAGTLEISQMGTTFSGSSTQTASCTTKGGQPATAPFPPLLSLVDGVVIGHSFRFTFDAFGILCPYQGAIQYRDGEPSRLRGSGDCQLPGEKELGHDFVRQFVAIRE